MRLTASDCQRRIKNNPIRFCLLKCGTLTQTFCSGDEQLINVVELKFRNTAYTAHWVAECLATLYKLKQIHRPENVALLS